MRAEELRKSILQQAVQGKLVKQNPADEPASVLLERIKAEKERLVQEGKLKKDKSPSHIFQGDDGRYYEKIGKDAPVDITDDLPFEIPESWCYSRLKNLVKIFTGKKDANFGSPDGIYDFFTCALEPIKSSSYSYDGQYIILPGNGANVGYSLLYKGKFEAYQRTYLLEKIHDNLLFEYLQIVLEAYWKDYNQDKQYGSAIPYIKLGNLEEFLVPLPPLAAQERIVKSIEELMPFVDEYARLEAKDKALDENLPTVLKKSILQHAIKGKLVEQDENDEPASVLLERIRNEKKAQLGKKYVESYIYKDGDCYYEKVGSTVKNISDEIPFDIPDTWCWARFSNLFNIQTGASFKKEEAKREYFAGSVRILRGGNIQPFAYELKPDDLYVARDINECNNCLPCNTLITPAVTSIENIGKVARIDKDLLDTNVGGFVYKFFPLYNDDTFSILCMYFMSSPFFVNSMKSITKKSGQAFYNMNKELFKNLLLPVPPLAEQKRIVEKLNEILANL